MESDLLQRLGNKEITKSELFTLVESNFSLVSVLLKGTDSTKPTIRYSCASVLTNLSEKNPDKLYPYWDNFIALLYSKYRILTWNALAIIANLTAVDVDRKFDALFDKYYCFLDNEYMVTVSNVVVNSATIASNKPYLADEIAAELLKVQNLKITPHLTEECKLVIAEQTISTLSTYFDRIQNKKPIVAFAKQHVNSTRTSLREKAQNFLKEQKYH